MVQAVRKGKSIRSVAKTFRVSPTTVVHWCNHAIGKRLDRVDWNSQVNEPVVASNRTANGVEKCVLSLRKYLKEHSDLGEHGADAIFREMQQRKCPRLPSRATINRILKRHGALDGRRRKRFLPPPTGWYLKPLSKKIAELDQFDYVEDLCIVGGTIIHVLNGISLHGGLATSYPMSRMTAENTVRKIIEHWKEVGLPDYAQFDNSMVFQGGMLPDTLGKVIRCCLSLGVTPVFVPPRETGFQASVESYNGRWQDAVWKRFHFDTLADVQRQSDKYVEAVRNKNQKRQDAAPARIPFPKNWTLDYSIKPKGKVIFIRRTTDDDYVEAMGHWWKVPTAGAYKLVRVEVNLTKSKISFYRIRRREPRKHELLATAKYNLPNRKFKE
jgi:hypothetical protein